MKRGLLELTLFGFAAGLVVGLAGYGLLCAGGFIENRLDQT